jgi:hypothetical protein
MGMRRLPIIAGLVSGMLSGLLAAPVSSAAEIAVGPPPPGCNADRFFGKYADAQGIPVLASPRVADAALVAAAEIVDHMLAKRPDVRAMMIRNHARVGVIGQTEVTLDMPDYHGLPPTMDWNARTRGLGGTIERPLTSCGEENLLHLAGDRYVGENILVHEFAHAVQLLGLDGVDPGFRARLADTYAKAMARGLWRKTYAATNAEEYWAEGAQDWFDCNRTADPPNGVHNRICTRAQLQEYDPDLHGLLATVFPDDGWRPR